MFSLWSKMMNDDVDRNSMLSTLMIFQFIFLCYFPGLLLQRRHCRGNVFQVLFDSRPFVTFKMIFISLHTSLKVFLDDSLNFAHVAIFLLYCCKFSGFSLNFIRVLMYLYNCSCTTLSFTRVLSQYLT